MSILVACMLGSNLGWTDAAFAQEMEFRGWISLIPAGRVGWLENENRLGALCPGEGDLDTCHGSHLAPAIDVYTLRTHPDSAAEVVGELIVTAMPGRGLASYHRAATATQALWFTPDVFLQDWGYGPPFFHQTFLEERDGWYRLPADPWDTPVWVDAKASGGLPELRLQAGDIIEFGGQGFYILHTAERTLSVRPEQDADMWCEAGDPPPLRPAEPQLLEWRDLVDERGHLLVRPGYMKGC